MAQLDELMNLPDFTEDLKICARCGFCKDVCPTFKFSDGFESYYPAAACTFSTNFSLGTRK